MSYLQNAERCQRYRPVSQIPTLDFDSRHQVSVQVYLCDIGTTCLKNLLQKPLLGRPPEILLSAGKLEGLGHAELVAFLLFAAQRRALIEGLLHGQQ